MQGEPNPNEQGRAAPIPNGQVGAAPIPNGPGGEPDLNGQGQPQPLPPNIQVNTYFHRVKLRRAKKILSCTVF